MIEVTFDELPSRIGSVGGAPKPFGEAEYDAYIEPFLSGSGLQVGAMVEVPVPEGRLTIGGNEYSAENVRSSLSFRLKKLVSKMGKGALNGVEVRERQGRVYIRRES